MCVGDFLHIFIFQEDNSNALKTSHSFCTGTRLCGFLVLDGFQTSIVHRSPVSAIARVVVSVGVAIAWFVIAITWPAIAAIA